MVLEDLNMPSETDANSTQVETIAGLNNRLHGSDFPLAAKKPNNVGISNHLVVHGDSGIDVISSNAHTRDNDSSHTAY